MHGEMRRVRWRADLDLVRRVDRRVKKTNGKQRHKYHFHFLYFLIPKPVPSTFLAIGYCLMPVPNRGRDGHY